jgi:hypothetical protein
MHSQFCSWQTLARGDRLAVLGMHEPLIAALETNALQASLTVASQAEIVLCEGQGQLSVPKGEHTYVPPTPPSG